MFNHDFAELSPVLNAILNLMASGIQSFQPYGAFYFVIMSVNENEGREYLFQIDPKLCFEFVSAL
jgi:hypothetical protein